jgi:ribose transport system permease protein
VLYAGTTGAADQLPAAGVRSRVPRGDDPDAGAVHLWGAIMAAYFLQTGITGSQLLGVESFVQQLFYGGALVIAVALSQVARRRQAHESGPAG